MSIKMTIDGLDEVQEALRQLPDSTAKSVVRRVLRNRAEPIAVRARALAPVDSGDLKDSIGVGPKLSRRQRSLHRKVDPDDIEIFIGAGPHPQAHMQEFGTEHNPPQAFMRPAWDEGKDRLLEGLKADLWEEIRKAAARMARKANRGGGG